MWLILLNNTESRIAHNLKQKRYLVSVINSLCLSSYKELDHNCYYVYLLTVLSKASQCRNGADITGTRKTIFLLLTFCLLNFRNRSG